MSIIFPVEDGSYWVDLGYACGVITFKNTKMIASKSAPIFKKLKYIPSYVKFKKLKNKIK